MFIESIELENIRSYKSQKIDFPKGITFLSGDIGSGKSSILQAIEFAFFGFKKGDIEGNDILRRGEKNGSVTLVLKSEKNEIEIYRTLKKTKTSIAQDSGYLKINNSLVELSPTELNAKIFEILELPQEFLTKDKNLIYRYTIYTPQEELKEILFSDVQRRLEVMRKLFNIDKYKQILNSLQVYTKNLRQQKREQEIRLEPIHKLKLEKKDVLDDLEEFKKEFDEVKEKAEGITAKTKQIQDLYINEEENLKKIQEKNFQVEKALNIIFEKEKQLQEIKDDILNKQERITLSKDKNGSKEKESIQKEIKALKEDLKNKEEKEEEIKNKELDEVKELRKNLEIEIQVLKAKIHEKENFSSDIFNKEKCPVCLQKIDEKHKEHMPKVLEKEKEDLKTKQNELNEKLSKIKNKEDELELKEKNSQSKKKEEINNLREKVYKKELEFSKLESKEKELKRELELIKELKEKQEKIEEIIKKKSDYEEKNKLIKEALLKREENINKISSKKELIREKEKIILEKLSTTRTRVSEKNLRLDKLEKEIISLEEIKKQIDKIQKEEKFLETRAAPILEKIEKYLFVRYYSEFNDYFEKYFRELIEDNEIDVRLDEEFSIIVEQNGYDIDVKQLSGGEKSSLALAYRLALRDLIENSTNKENKLSTLILDEPTDGFSNEQVSRLGLLLQESSANQIIVVSHDETIESIAENILHVNKKNHLSVVE